MTMSIPLSLSSSRFSAVRIIDVTFHEDSIRIPMRDDIP